MNNFHSFTRILVNVAAPEKRTSTTPNNLSQNLLRQEEIYEKIPVLDQPDADAYVQKPYTSICLDRSEKSSLNVKLNLTPLLTAN